MSVQPPLNRALIMERFGGGIEDLGASHGIDVFAVPPETIVEFCRFLKEHPALQFNFLSDICGVDHYPEMPRYEAVYHL